MLKVGFRQITTIRHLKHSPACVSAVMVAFLSSAAGAAPLLTLTSGQSYNRNTPFNLITNGSFENGVGAPDATNPVKYWATGTTQTPFAVPAGWSSIGGTAAYAAWTYDTVGPYTYGSDVLPHGNRGMYFGNQFTSAISQPPTFNSATGVVTFPNPPTITPLNATYTPAVQLTQTVTGLNTSQVYKFSFWTSGESARNGGYYHDGIFGLDVTGFNTIYLQAPGGAGAYTVGISHRYEFFLQPASPNTTFTWTNWGHYGNGVTTGWNISVASDELVLDDVILNAVPEPTSLALIGLGALVLRRRSWAIKPTV